MQTPPPPACAHAAVCPTCQDEVDRRVSAAVEPPAGCPLGTAHLIILAELARGGTYRSAARRQGVPYKTVVSRVGVALRLLGAASSTQAVAIALRAGWLR